MIIKGESDDATYCTFISRTADYAWIRKCQRDLASENEWYFNILIAAGIFTVFITGRLTVYSLAACGVLWQRTLCWRCFEHCTRRQQIWLLQHSTGRGLSVTHWSTPVSAQRCRWSRVLGKTIRTCDSTSRRPSLVEGPGKNQVPSLCFDTSVSTWNRAAIPCRDTTTDLRHVCTSSSSVCRKADAGRLFDPSFNTWRPSVSCVWLPHASGTLCRPRCEQSSHWRRSGAAWRQNCSSPPSPRPNCLHLTVLLHYQHTCF